jgi:hypothetical protein
MAWKQEYNMQFAHVDRGVGGVSTLYVTPIPSVNDVECELYSPGTRIVALGRRVLMVNQYPLDTA